MKDECSLGHVLANNLWIDAYPNMSTSLSYLKRSIRSTTPPAHDSKRRKMPMYTRVVQVDDHQPSLKRERSPTPLPLNTPRTSGTVHASIPDACRKSTPGWQASREKWVAEETRKLKALGLVIEKRLIRLVYNS